MQNNEKFLGILKVITAYIIYQIIFCILKNFTNGACNWSPTIVIQKLVKLNNLKPFKFVVTSIICWLSLVFNSYIKASKDQLKIHNTNYNIHIGAY